MLLKSRALELESQLELAQARIIELEIQLAKQQTSRDALLRYGDQYTLGIVLLVSAQNIVEYVNPRVKDILGYSAEEFRTINLSSVVHSEDRELYAAAFEELLSSHGEERTFEMRLRHKNGEWVWFEMAVSNHLKDPDLHGLLMYGHDITLRNTAIVELEATLEHFRAISNLTSDYAFLYSVEPSGKLKTEWVTNSYTQITGFQPGEPRDRGPYGLYIEEDRERVQHDIQATLEGKAVTGEYRIITKAGEKRWLRITRQPMWDVAQKRVTRFYGAAQDITDQKIVEKARSSSERLYGQMFELHGLPKLIIDASNGHIVDANPAAARFYGYDIDTLKTLTMFDVNLSPVEAVKKKMAEAATSKMLTCRYVHRAAGGIARDVEVFTGPIEIDGDYFLFSIIVDITEEQQAKRALQAANERLEKRVAERTAELEATTNRIEAIINHSGDGIVLLDTNNVIQQTNTAFNTVLGDKNCVGRQLATCIHPDYAGAVEESIAAVISTHQKQQVEAQVILTDGQLADVELSIAPINNSQNATTNLVCIVRDITERKQSERALRESQTMLQNVIENIPVGIVWTDINSVYKGGNTLFARKMGVTSSSELVGKRAGDFEPEYAAEWEADDRHMIEAGVSRLNLEECFMAPDNKPQWYIHNKIPLKNGHEEVTGILITSEDITERKLAEEALKASEERLRVLFETSPDTICLVDLRGNVIDINGAGERLIGMVRQQIIGQNVMKLNLFNKPIYAAQAAQGLAVTQSGKSRVSEYELLRHDGLTIHIEAVTHPIQLKGEMLQLAVIRDITARRQAEKALRETKDQLQAILDHSTASIFMKDLDGRILLINKTTGKDYGIVEHDWIGKFEHDFFPPERIAHFNQTDNRVIDSGQPANYEETIGDRTIWTTKFPIFDAEHKIYAIGGISTDITERKQYEQSLERALAKAKELNELKSRFISTTSHEFRTPLATILATTESLSAYRDRMTAEQIEGRLTKITQQVIHLRSIMEDVLQLSRIQAGKVNFNPEAGDLDKLCRDIVDEFNAQKLHLGRVQYVGSDGSLMTLFDPRLMRQIISNLISNGLKYSPAVQPVEVSLHQCENQIILQVRDQGIGIPQTDLEHLFEPFHRAQNVGTISGTGLGLSITKQAIELHGGTIRVNSQINVGTTFVVTLSESQVNSSIQGRSSA